MPLTKLDPKTALILIDLQKGIVGMPTVHPAAEIVSRAAAQKFWGNENPIGKMIHRPTLTTSRP